MRANDKEAEAAGVKAEDVIRAKREREEGEAGAKGGKADKDKDGKK